MERGNLGLVLMVLSLVPLAFLLWTATHIGELDIPLWHPLVLAEAGTFLALLLIGRYYAFISTNGTT